MSHCPSPREIVTLLDEHIIGQQAAKRAVAIALRNRWRRRQVVGSLREEILPKNILLIGRTGVGKTELARRLAHLADAPFLKVEATRFTEVGYVGRDVESMIRDLVELGVALVRKTESAKVEAQAAEAVERQLVDLLLDDHGSDEQIRRGPMRSGLEEAAEAPELGANERRRRLLERLRAGDCESDEVSVSVKESRTPRLEVFSGSGYEDMAFQLRNMMKGFGGERRTTKRRTVAEAREILMKAEIDGLLDAEKIEGAGVELAQSSGIIFLDEIDKVAMGPRQGSGSGPDVSREGVQRDLLPIIEGTTVTTRHGQVKTDHILFIASGSFSFCKPSDLIPELQGRLPIRVEMDDLGREELERILVEPRAALVRQYRALLEAEGVELSFRDEAVAELARVAQDVNERTDNIGARRLHTVMEKLLEDLLFEAPERSGEEVEITREYVEKKLHPILEQEDLSRFIL